VQRAAIAVVVITALIAITGCVNAASDDVGDEIVHETLAAKGGAMTCTGEEVRDYIDSKGEEPLLCSVAKLGTAGAPKEIASELEGDPEAELNGCIHTNPREGVRCTTCCNLTRCCYGCWYPGGGRELACQDW